MIFRTNLKLTDAMHASITLWEMNLFLAKDLAHYNTDYQYEFHVYRIDLYDFSRYVFSKGGILFITFLFKNSKKNKNKLWHYADQNTDTHPPTFLLFRIRENYIYVLKV